MRTLLCLLVLAACGGSGSHSAVDAAVPDDATDGGATGATCGGFARLPCGADEFCDYPDNGCGIGDQTGSCRKRPAVCPLTVAVPTCACDGKLRVGECDAYVDGVDLNAHGTCDVMPGRFVCGYTQCNLATHYCLRQPHPDAAETFTCVALPQPACTGTASCDCLAGERCGNACTGDARSGLTLSCAPAK